MLRAGTLTLSLPAYPVTIRPLQQRQLIRLADTSKPILFTTISMRSSYPNTALTKLRCRFPAKLAATFLGTMFTAMQMTSLRPLLQLWHL